MTVTYAPRTQTAAVARALTFNGKAYPAGWCQAFVVTQVFGTGGVGDYDGDRAADAEDGWKKARDRGHVVKVPTGLSATAMTAWLKAVPAGYMAYWTGGSSDHGHAAVTLGNGKLFTTDKTPGVCGIVDLTWPHTHWGLTFVGYATVDGNGFTLTDRPGTSTPPVAVWGNPATYVLGSTGPDVTKLGERIVVWSKALGLPSPYRTGPGSPLTVSDVDALAKIQKAWGDNDADGYPGPLTFTRLVAEPAQVQDVPVFYMNAADYDSVGKGKRTRFSRTPSICAKAIEGHPMWVLLVECAGDTLANREVGDATVLGRDARMVGYKRVGAGGKGREAWYAKDAGITILQAQLFRAQPELDDDDKPFLVIAWQADGYKAVTTVFHNENQGTSVQKGQLDYVRRTSFGVAKSHGVAAGNVLIVGDANRKEAAADLTAAGMLEAGTAPSTSNLQYHSTNGWGVTTSIGRRIDVAALGAGGQWVYAKMLRLAKAITDHNPFRLSYRITK